MARADPELIRIRREIDAAMAVYDLDRYLAAKRQELLLRKIRRMNTR